MPNVKAGEICQIRGCPDMPEANGHWVTAEVPALPNELVLVRGECGTTIPVHCNRNQWICSSRGGTPLRLSDTKTIITKRSVYCDACLHPVRPEGDGKEDSEVTGLKPPVTDMRDLVTKGLPPAERRRKLTPA